MAIKYQLKFLQKFEDQNFIHFHIFLMNRAREVLTVLLNKITVCPEILEYFRLYRFGV